MSNTDYFVEIESEITRLKRCEQKSTDKIKELALENEKAIDTLCKGLLSVLDAFDRADVRLSEQFPDNENVNCARKRFATSRRKLADILERYQVQEITFPDGKAIENDCQITDTEPDLEKENDTIISIEKPGYRRNGRLLRLAEVVVVRN